jgi:rod shape determining protein RodA
VFAYGVLSVFFFHIAVNIAMTIGLAPVIGIPLPFISYGGTSLLTFTVLLAILIRLDADRQMVLR